MPLVSLIHTSKGIPRFNPAETCSNAHAMIIDIYTHILPDRFFQEMSRVSPKRSGISMRRSTTSATRRCWRVGAQPSALQIGQEALTQGGILRGAIPEAERVFGAGGVDAERDHDAVLADVKAVDQQRHQIDRLQRGRSPGLELRGGLHDKSATHRALAGAADADLGADRL